MIAKAGGIGKPQIRSEVCFRVAGPQAREFRDWVNKEFNAWVRREFKVKGFCDGRAHRSEGELSVVLEFAAPADRVLDRIVADFPALQFSFGHVWERTGRRFGTSNGHIEYDFTDQNGVAWHGANGKYAASSAAGPLGRLFQHQARATLRLCGTLA